VYPDRYKPDASFHPTSDRYDELVFVNNCLRWSRDSQRDGYIDAPYIPSRTETPWIYPMDGFLPKSEPTPEQLRMETRCDPEWEGFVGAPALSVKAKLPQLGRIHERRRGAPLPQRAEAPWMKAYYHAHNTKMDPYGQPVVPGHPLWHGGRDPVDGRVAPSDMDEVAAADGPDTWKGNKIFFKEQHLGRAMRYDAERDAPGSPAKGAEEHEREAMVDAEDARMEARFATRYHAGKDLGCGAPPRVYSDAWCRDTPNWDVMREERTHGIEYDTSWWLQKEGKPALDITRTSPNAKLATYEQQGDCCYTLQPLKMQCALTKKEVQAKTCVVKSGVVAYTDEAAANADWRRHEKEALFLGFYADRFGTAVEYDDYVTAKHKAANDELSWIAHAMSECPLGRALPPAPVPALAGSGITQVAILGDGYVVGTETGEIREFGNADTSQLPQMQSAVSKLLVSDNFLAAGTDAGTVVIAEWATGQIEEISAAKSRISDLHAVGFCLAVAAEDGSASVWDAHTKELVMQLEGHDEAVTSIRCIRSKGGAVVDMIATSSLDTTIKMWELKSGECRATLAQHGEVVTCMDLVGDRLVSGGLDGIVVWSASSGKCLSHVEQCGDVSHVKMVGNVLIIARNGHAAGAKTEVVVFDWEKGRELSRLYLGNMAVGTIDVSVTRVALLLVDPDSPQTNVLVWDFHASLPHQHQMIEPNGLGVLPGPLMYARPH